LVGMILDLVGEVGDQLGSLCQVGPPARMAMEHSWNAREPRQRMVEFCDGLGSEELFGCDVEAVGVALDRLEKPRRWVVEFAEHGAGGDRRFIAAEDLLQRLAWRAELATSSRVGASMMASSPAARSETQALNASSVVVAGSPTWTRP
jgi:hypothetical protein